MRDIITTMVVASLSLLFLSPGEAIIFGFFTYFVVRVTRVADKKQMEQDIVRQAEELARRNRDE